MSPESSELLTLADLEEAAAGLRGVAVRTPLLESPALSAIAGVPVYLKLESQQPTGAFKLRGAWTALRRLPQEQRRRGVITYSSGNHGQALAYAAQRMGVSAVVVMPETAPEAKVEGVRRWGGEVVFAGTTSEDRYQKAMLLAHERGLAVIPPFDHRDIVAGQGTVGLEILEQLPEVTDIAAPVGGGGLAGGIAAALRCRKREVKLTTVEPEGSAALKAALAAGKPVRLERTHSVADGLLPLAVGRVPFVHLHNFAHAVTVTEAAIVEATRWLFYQQKLVVEPSGAVTTAALRSGAFRPSGPAVLVVSGGNVDPIAIARLV